MVTRSSTDPKIAEWIARHAADAPPIPPERCREIGRLIATAGGAR